ncbi:MAG: hypothetical protein NVS1B2_23370 [Vulcanimicrobiaceae bacterium]
MIRATPSFFRDKSFVRTYLYDWKSLGRIHDFARRQHTIGADTKSPVESASNFRENFPYERTSFSIIALAIGATVGPALASESAVATTTTTTGAPGSVVAYEGRNVLAAPALTADESALYGYRIIGITATVSSNSDVPFTLDVLRAPNPMQMDAVFDREIARVFEVTHTP